MRSPKLTTSVYNDRVRFNFVAPGKVIVLEKLSPESLTTIVVRALQVLQVRLVQDTEDLGNEDGTSVKLNSALTMEWSYSQVLIHPNLILKVCPLRGLRWISLSESAMETVASA